MSFAMVGKSNLGAYNKVDLKFGKSPSKHTKCFITEILNMQYVAAKFVIQFFAMNQKQCYFNEVF